ncbi:hypothetical protein HJC23_013147 [Cyclotella cryptica]|uniref:Phosphoglycerate mutase-like protein n=1 Tax=Cyclotella cryptica TaxID=29204 RepID=A0ABD3QML0_9STRA|eukprot:CCRYP_003956-RA/>CCRYP_003956-RA protein AED:0.09 eAED:0.09 QI:121/1/1/1/1/1/2/168/302
MDSTDSHPTVNAANAQPKTVYLIRHGVAKHNICNPETGERPDIANDVTLTDPPLVRQGVWQAQVLGENLRRRGIAAEKGFDQTMDVESCDGAATVELVVCSPLTRCLQTASYVFPGHFTRHRNHDTSACSNHSNNHKSESISNEYTIIRSRKTPLTILNGDCRVFCHEDVREAFGMHYPDKRSPLSHLKATFPNVTFHPCMTEHDTAWSPHTRETYHDVIHRVRNFFQWLSHQPHNCIAIVTHGVWMECALMEYCPEVLEGGKKRVYNCEVYCGKLVVMESFGVEDPCVKLKNVRPVSLYNT